MASTTDVSLVIAGIGHVYYGAPDTPVPANGLFDYDFGDGTTLEKDSWTWMGDTSSENKLELSTDGGDSTTKRTWDRVNVRETKAAKTTTLTLNSVSISNDTIQVAFPGATYDPDLQMWSLPDDAAAERKDRRFAVKSQLNRTRIEIVRYGKTFRGLPGRDGDDRSIHAAARNLLCRMGGIARPDVRIRDDHTT